MRRDPVALAHARRAIDAVDDALVLLFALRRQLARAAAQGKRNAALPASDPAREHAVRRRAQRLARHCGLPGTTAQALIDLAIADARRGQGLAEAATPDVGQGSRMQPRRMIAADMHAPDFDSAPSPWLRLLPPPARWAMLLRACPPALQRGLLERAMARVLAAPLQAGALDFLQDRKLGIEVTDLQLQWTVALDGDRLRAIDGSAEASVRGSATDLLLLAGRLEDADTLFFQRRLELTGDVELGLTARNVLDRLPWERVPLGLRIALNRGARLAQAARAAHHAS
jgi:predicted lipid carrier protein YhbT/chorismate mutase